jgi:propionyl-CoA carboxylase alpha chain
VIASLLVANRGEIACRIIRTARQMGVRCVAVYVDADAASPHVGEADEAVRLLDGYLDGEAIVAAAKATGAEAVHPGYGFLSESAAFAAAVQDAGLVWVGPPPAVIEAMGDKLAAKRLAEQAGVPTLPSSDRPDDAGEAARVGYPVVVKAAAGGGGKGMRVVDSPEHLAEAVAAARREARAGFGDDRVFLERYVARSRHIEIQLLGDHHGNLVHLGERECSIQRRHQKVVEESPSPAVDRTMRAAMGEAALRLGRSMGYSSAGTVEFLVDDATGAFFFLEVNTRLQVEHPVTEEVTGIDLVREQLRIAAGESLDVDQDDIRFRGHAIEVRLYAEDPANDFLPVTGTLAAFEPAEAPAVRWDSGVVAGSVVGTRFDPMLAKVIAHAPTRSEAAGRLALALERLHVGGMVTNRDFLAAILRSAAFAAGDTTTDFIERTAPAPAMVLSDVELRHAATMAALWLQARNRATATIWQGLPSGWRNARLPAQQVTFGAGAATVAISYQARRDGSVVIGDGVTARVHAHTPHSIDAEIGGRRMSTRITRHGEHLYVQTTRGTVRLHELPRFHVPGDAGPAGGLNAPMPGAVLDVRVAAGDRVAAGQMLVVLEAMKMEHHIKAPTDGVVAEVRVAAGQQVDNGALLLVITAGDETDVQRADTEAGT